ncbi:type VI secretion system accessory protein TagJ [Phaeobacter sp. HF9A]|uniref:type VI secretion system accessory protein TagJ n=1 Tax=Phaeobacter sp. HF9A TaxID=2721561 RepID=UPI0014304B44|nr:type VI secretion system accessory protein TagJ [Phaeobacter sp. HF9A]NIZ15085.1 tetratricopeptide repeat protein [Phaeobacter sp. HF9A]
MTAQEYLKAGDPAAALSALQDQVRKDPSNGKLRIFLFQLLCVLGDWKRAVTQLKLSADMDSGATTMAQAYREAIICEVYRDKVFKGEKDPLIFGEPQEWLALLIQAQKALAAGDPVQAAAVRARAFDAAPATAGELNGTRFEWIADADMRLGPVLEVIVNGRYFWMPFSQIDTLELEEPADLRDAVWMAGTLTPKGGGALAVLVPTRYPGAAEIGGLTALARETNWVDLGADTYGGQGQRVLATDQQDVALMDLRLLKMDGGASGDG